MTKHIPQPLAPVNPEGLEEIARQLLEETPEILKTPGSSLEDKASFWTITNVPYRNQLYDIDLLKTLLDNGATKTQDQWSEYAKQAIPKGEFHAADFPLYHALFATLYHVRDGPSKAATEEIQQFLNDKFTKYWLMTLTRVIYTPSGKDKVIHRLGLPDQYTIDEVIIGPNEWVKKAVEKAPYKALFGADDTAEIQSVYHWLTGREAYLWRLNTKQETPQGRVAGFVAGSGGACLDCGGGPADSDPALGVRACAAGAKKI